jgi:hypothetical protein
MMRTCGRPMHRCALLLQSGVIAGRGRRGRRCRRGRTCRDEDYGGQYESNPKVVDHRKLFGSIN